MTTYYKMRQILSQNATTILLQNATEVYYKMRQFFYDNFIIKRDSYYKIRLLLQITAVYSFIIYLNSLVRLAFHNSYERY